jgi:hypothetical protein
MQWPNLLEMLMVGSDVRMLNSTVLEGWPNGYPPTKTQEPVIRAGIIQNEQVTNAKLFPMTDAGLDEALAHVRAHIRARGGE